MAAISRVAFDSSLSPLVILDQNFDMIRMNEAAQVPITPIITDPVYSGHLEASRLVLTLEDPDRTAC